MTNKTQSEEEKQIRNKIKSYLLGHYDIEIDNCVSDMLEIVKQSNKSLLNRIKTEIIGKDEPVKRIMQDTDVGFYIETDSVAVGRNEHREEQRKALSVIKKERGIE